MDGAGVTVGVAADSDIGAVTAIVAATAIAVATEIAVAMRDVAVTASELAAMRLPEVAWLHTADLAAGAGASMGVAVVVDSTAVAAGATAAGDTGKTFLS